MVFGYQDVKGRRRSKSDSSLQVKSMCERRGSSDLPTREEKRRGTEDLEDDAIRVLIRSHEKRNTFPDQPERSGEVIEILETLEPLTSPSSKSDPLIVPLVDGEPLRPNVAAHDTPVLSPSSSLKSSLTPQLSLLATNFTNSFSASFANSPTITSQEPTKEDLPLPQGSRRPSHVFGVLRQKSFVSVASVFRFSDRRNTIADISEEGQFCISSKASTPRRRSTIRKRNIGKPRFEGWGAFEQSPLQIEVIEEPLDTGNTLREITVENLWRRHLREFRRKLSTRKSFQILKGDLPPPRERATSLSEPNILSHPYAWKIWNARTHHTLYSDRRTVSRPPDMYQDRSEIDMLRRTSTHAIELDMISGGVDSRIEANKRSIERLHAALAEKSLRSGRERGMRPSREAEDA